MKARVIIAVCLTSLITAACLVSPIAALHIQNIYALNYSEQSKISPLSISKKSLTVAQKFELFVNAVSETSDVSVSSVGRDTALLDSDTVTQAFYDEIDKIKEKIGFDFNLEKNAEKSKQCNPEIFVSNTDPSYYAIFWRVRVETENGNFSFVMDDETKMLYEFSIYSDKAKVIDDKNDILEGFGKGIGEYIGADMTNSEFDEYSDANYITYSFPDGLEICCYVTVLENLSEVSVTFTDFSYDSYAENLLSE